MVMLLVLSEFCKTDCQYTRIKLHTTKSWKLLKIRTAVFFTFKFDYFQNPTLQQHETWTRNRTSQNKYSNVQKLIKDVITILYDDMFFTFYIFLQD